MFKDIRYFVLSRWFFGSYFSLGVVYFFSFKLCIGNIGWANLLFMTLGLMTGSDPYSFRDVHEGYSLIWSLSWVIHIGSWLLIPALVGLLVNDAAQDIRNQGRLQEAFENALRRMGVSEGELSSAAAYFQDKVKDMIEESKRKGAP